MMPSVSSRSFLFPLPPPPFHINLPPTHTCQQGLEPLPSLEGCGPKSKPQNSDPTTSAPPLSRGMWAAQVHSMEEWGWEKHKGGPRVWEAHVVHHENEPRWTLWFIFLFLHVFHPTDRFQPMPNHPTMKHAYHPPIDDTHNISQTPLQQAPSQGTTMMMTDHHASLANATMIRPNDEGHTDDDKYNNNNNTTQHNMIWWQQGTTWHDDDRVQHNDDRVQHNDDGVRHDDDRVWHNMMMTGYTTRRWHSDKEEQRGGGGGGMLTMAWQWQQHNNMTTTIGWEGTLQPTTSAMEHSQPAVLFVCVLILILHVPKHKPKEGRALLENIYIF